MSSEREAVLAGYVRTPFGKADPQRGWFRNVRSDDLATVVLQEILRRTGRSGGRRRRRHPRRRRDDGRAGASRHRDSVPRRFPAARHRPEHRAGVHDGDDVGARGGDERAVRPRRGLHRRRPRQHDPLPHPDDQGRDGHGRHHQGGRSHAGRHESESEDDGAHQPDRAQRRPGRRAAVRPLRHHPPRPRRVGAAQPSPRRRRAGERALRRRDRCRRGDHAGRRGARSSIATRGRAPTPPWRRSPA